MRIEPEENLKSAFKFFLFMFVGFVVILYLEALQ
ncbi:hypothetical protein TAC_0002 [Acinetobacter phage TAC1]|nr:hypothetical protein TAC_0002 [Acinetobacter phage TAC1]